ncbi:MAG: branched-chain amino acid ABC transporter permease [Thermodesulfobacteriota bacterium]|jgi:branched-chain amino acid transport system permease protein
MTGFLQIFLNCLVLSANYILLAVGLTLIFGILRTLNFAHGSLYIVGAYIVYALFKIMGVNYFLAMVAAIIGVAGLGIFLEATILFPMTKQKSFLTSLGAILGVSMVIEGALSFIFLGEDVTIGSIVTGTVSIFGATLSVERILVVILCGLIMLGVYIWIHKTRQGIAIRALAENPRVANMQGISTRFIRFLVIAIASTVAGVAGAIITPLFYLNPYLGGYLVFKALVIVAVGGMGSVEGSILAGLLIGFIEGIGLAYIGPIAEALSFIIIIAIFLFRPRGLLGVEYEFH